MVLFLVFRSKNCVVLSMDVVIILSSSGANNTLVIVLLCRSNKLKQLHVVQFDRLVSFEIVSSVSTNGFL